MCLHSVYTTYKIEKLHVLEFEENRKLVPALFGEH